MPNKKTHTYEKVFEAIKVLGKKYDRRGVGFRPSRIQMDFEIPEKVCLLTILKAFSFMLVVTFSCFGKK